MSDDNTPSEALILSRIRSPWGRVSRGFCIVGGVLAIIGGMSLVGLRARGDNSMMEAIANGMGFYFLGKGVFMIAISINIREALQLIRSR